jgi:hypothetical protein
VRALSGGSSDPFHRAPAAVNPKARSCGIGTAAMDWAYRIREPILLRQGAEVTNQSHFVIGIRKPNGPSKIDGRML